MSLDADRAATLARLSVSRETETRLDWLVAELLRWQRIKNLVAPSTLDQVWTRHVLDSWQLLRWAPGAGPWMDLGSGGGFPGLVVAIERTERQAGRTILVESNGRKAAFLRHVVAALRLDAEVRAERIETVLQGWSAPLAVVSARALAPLAQLLQWTHGLLRNGAVGIFPKGQDVEAELSEASRYWSFDVETHSSVSDPKGTILVVRMLPQPGRPAHVDP